MFPKDFLWGAASSAYQIEGAARIDGKGPSNWDAFCRQPGRVFFDQHGEVACDHYGRMKEDVALMKSLAMKAYRFSVSWPRVMPEGTGAVNAAGLGFYDRLVDELLANGIEPWLTLFHWDFPHALHLRGGWMNPDSSKWFADYARVVVDRLSDRVTKWMTINEPQIYVGHGHLLGTHAPGYKLPLSEVLLVGHNTLLGHGRTVQVIRAHAKSKPTVGWAPCGRVDYPATESAVDIEAARRQMFRVHTKDAWSNTWWADPVCLGRYPEDGLKLFGAEAPTPAPGDMETIHQPLDFYGVNIYSGTKFRAGPDGVAQEVQFAQGHPQTAFGWFIVPESLYWGPRFLHERYKLPIYVTENGLACMDSPGPDGRVRDPQRIEFTRGYLTQFARAAQEGYGKGYFHWSILDNFEWAEGYSKRFGLVYVDYETMNRIPKDSAYWYRDVIRSNGGTLMDESSSRRDGVLEIKRGSVPAAAL